MSNLDTRMEYVRPYPTDLECAICLSPWCDPVELTCHHIFCRGCVSTQPRCPSCRAEITSRNQPHFLMRNMVNALPVRCTLCASECTRETFSSHSCTSTSSPASNSSSPRASLPSSPSLGQRHGSSGVFSSSRQGRVPELKEWEKLGLSQSEYDHLCAVFLNFDDDDSGALNRTELTKLATWLNFPHSPADIDRMFAEADQGRHGKLTLQQFCALMKDKRPDPTTTYGLTVQDYHAILLRFHECDRDSDGRLSATEFAQLCHAMKAWYPTDNPYELFQRIDTDRNQTIDLHEFLQYNLAIRRPRG